ncbi:hypothetical protein [Helicobacter pylori]|nr:hypothetical protein [Helicobacter pylori]
MKNNRQDKGKGGGGDPSILSGANQTIRNGWIYNYTIKWWFLANDFKNYP